jgi:hypothetical protein
MLAEVIASGRLGPRRLLYASGGYKEERSGNSIRSRTLGYLSAHELKLANDILAPERSRPKVTPFLRALTAHRKVAFLAFIVIGISGTFGAKEFYRVWEMHKTLLTDQAKVQLPMRINAYTTLVDVRVGFRSWTSFSRALSRPRRKTLLHIPWHQIRL